MDERIVLDCDRCELLRRVEELEALVREVMRVYSGVRNGAQQCNDGDVVAMCDDWLDRARAALPDAEAK